MLSGLSFRLVAERWGALGFGSFAFFWPCRLLMGLRGLRMINNLMMIQHDDIVRAEVMNPAVAILDSLRARIMEPRKGTQPTTRGLLEVKASGTAGGIAPLGETVATGGAATDDKTSGDGAGIHGARRQRTLVPPMAVRGTTASSHLAGRPVIAAGTMAQAECLLVLRTLADRVNARWFLLSMARSMPPTMTSALLRDRMCGR